MLTIHGVLSNSHNDPNKHYKYDIPTLLMRKLKHREAKKLAQSHTTRKWQSWNSNRRHTLELPFVITNTTYTQPQGFSVREK